MGGDGRGRKANGSLENIPKVFRNRSITQPEHMIKISERPRLIGKKMVAMSPDGIIIIRNGSERGVKRTPPNDM